MHTIRVLLMASLAAGYSISSRQKNSPTDVCTRWSHQSALVNSTLYIYGGQAKTSASQKSDTWNNDFIQLDLSKDFRIDSVPFKGLPVAEGPPAVANGYMWNDYDQLYLYGGLYSDSPVKEPDPFSLYKYAIKDLKWSVQETTSESGTPPIQRSAEGAGVTHLDRGIGYYFGGHLDGYTTQGWSQSTPRVYLKSMVSYDMHTSKWSNITVDSNGFPERADGVLVSVPYGREGIVIGLAGGTNESFSQLNIVDVFDIATSKWYKQATSGPTPEIRVNPCAVLFSAPDGSSHNIYMYGGQNLIPYGSQTQYSDMWILTIPSFTWMKVDTKDQSVPYPRAGHTCNAYNGQIVVVGGYVGTDISCDSPGVYIFDATELSWKNDFKAGTIPAASVKIPPYLVPTLVVSEIGGDNAGGATENKPKVEPDADSPFATPINPSIYPYTTFPAHDPSLSTSKPAGPSSASESSNRGKGTNIGAIIGGTIGGIAIIVGLAFLGMYMIYRRRINRLRKSLEESQAREGLTQANTRSSMGTYTTYNAGANALGMHHEHENQSKESIMEGVEPTFWGMLLSPKRSLRIVNM